MMNGLKMALGSSGGNGATVGVGMCNRTTDIRVATKQTVLKGVRIMVVAGLKKGTSFVKMILSI